MAEGKAVKYRIEGRIELSAGMTLVAAENAIKALVDDAKKLGTAKGQMSVPRLTDMEV